MFLLTEASDLKAEDYAEAGGDGSAERRMNPLYGFKPNDISGDSFDRHPGIAPNALYFVCSRQTLDTFESSRLD